MRFDIGLALLCAGALGAAGCKNTTTAPVTPSDVYPLGVGSRWEYTSALADSVTRTIVLGGKEYVEIQGDLMSGFFRLNDRHQLIVRESETSPVESILFDFEVPVGSAWSFASPENEPTPTVTLVSKQDTITVPSGTYTGCYTFFFDVPDDVGQDNTYVVAPEVGLVYLLRHSGSSYSLTDYRPAP